jgi:hypothetical protein
MGSKFTRTGIRRAGDDYQDAIALKMFFEMLDRPEKYEWTRVEAGKFHFLDDVVTLRSDGKYEIKQVKFTGYPEENKVSWDYLTKKKDSTKSLLQKWNESLKKIREKASIHSASLVTNRELDEDIKKITSTGFIKFDKINDPIRAIIIDQIGDEETAKDFFENFYFDCGWPNIDLIEESVSKRFARIGVTEKGWFSLKDKLRFWIRNKNKPRPNGTIKIEDIKKAALWYNLRSLHQNFEIPLDYVVPSKSFHESLKEKILQEKDDFIVITGSPGVGKSTYLSYLFNELNDENIPVVRHHYYLSSTDREFERFDHRRVSESIMSDILNKFPDELGGLGNKNPFYKDLFKWIEKCGKSFKKEGKKLVLIIDGLDHVIRRDDSVKELKKFFDLLLPIPDGILIILGTQELDESHLPRNLVLASPKESWIKIPFLDKKAVQEWLINNKEKINVAEIELKQLSEYFYQKSEGHPLHLKYSLRYLLEQEIPINENSIKSLPGISHQDIRAYYDELWLMLNDEEHQVLHLLAACDFVWPIEGLIDCFTLQGVKKSQINYSIKRVKHLLESTDLGFIPFHSSIVVFVKNLNDHSIFAGEMKEYTLEWLKNKAPSYWKWAYEWLLEAELGNSEPLNSGPDRDWLIGSISKALPKEEMLEILKKSSENAIEEGNLQTHIKVKLLYDYVENAHFSRKNILDSLIYSQIAVGMDEYVKIILYEDINELSETGLALVAEYQSLKNKSVSIPLNEIINRYNDSHASFEYDRDQFRKEVKLLLKMEVLNNDINRLGIISRFAKDFRDVNFSYNILEYYTRFLRIYSNLPDSIDMLFDLLKYDFDSFEISAILKNLVLLSFEEHFDLDEIVKNNNYDAFSAIYAFINDLNSFNLGKIQFPNEEIFLLKETEQLIYKKDVGDAFYKTFFCFLANHLWSKPQENIDWISTINTYEWPKDLLNKLNNITCELSEIFVSKSAPDFSWIYGQLNTLKKPEWPEDRKYHSYWAGFLNSISYIGIDICILSKKFGFTKITEGDLLIAAETDYWFVDKWTEVYFEYRELLMDENAVLWILNYQKRELSSNLELLSDRALKYSFLASLAALHEIYDESKRNILETSSNLISYGDSKDLLLDDVLGSILTCHELGVKGTFKWLFQISSAIDHVLDFTDGDETSHLVGYMGSLISKIKPVNLISYYEYLNGKSDYHNAQQVFHSFLKESELSEEIDLALAMTGISNTSLQILSEKAKKNKNMELILDSCEFKYKPNKPNNYGLRSEKENLIIDSPGNFSFEDLEDYIDSTKLHYREKKVAVDCWINFWINAGKGKELLDVIVKLEEKGVELHAYDEIYGMVLKQFGATKAFEWLLKAHIDDVGWDYRFTCKDKAFERFNNVKKYHNDQWFEFIQKTYINTPSIVGSVERLIQYCQLMEEKQLAFELTNQLIESTVELVSPLNLSSSEWWSND